MTCPRRDDSRAEEVEALAEKTLSAFGGVHLLCNNAGAGTMKLVWECTLRDWEWVMGVNFWGVGHGIRVFAPIMLEQDEESHIVSTSSATALLPSPRTGVYNGAKAAIMALSETLYLELKERNAKVGVSVLCPGLVRTGLAPDRHRPSALMNENERPRTAEEEQWARGLRAVMNQGMPPEQVADIVFQGVRDNRFLIFTHPENKAAVRARMENLLNDRNPENGTQGVGVFVQSVSGT